VSDNEKRIWRWGVSEQMQRIHDKIAECDREAELRGWDTSGFPRLWFAALSRVAGLDLQERRRKARHPADGSIPLPVTRDTSPGICELQQQNDELQAEIARLRESLAIFVHAHATGNIVPPHLEAAAKELVKEVGK